MAQSRKYINELPPELLDQVFDMVEHEDMKSCSLVCRQWTFPTFSRLYERACITTSSEDPCGIERFSTSTHLFPFVKHLSLRHNAEGGLEILTLGRVLSQLPRLSSLQLHARSLFAAPHDHHDLLQLPPLELRKLDICVTLAMEDASFYLFFHLFNAIDELVIDDTIFYLAQASGRPFIPPKKLRARALTISYNSSSLPFATWKPHRTDRAEILQRLLHCDALEHLDDSACGGIVGVEDSAVWSSLKELRLGSKYKQPLDRFFYPALTSLHLGDVCIVRWSPDVVDCDHWPVLGQTVLNAPASLREFSFGITLSDFGRRAAERYSLALDTVLIPSLCALDWSTFAAAVDTYPLLCRVEIVVYVAQGACRHSYAEIEEELGKVVMPKCFASLRARQVVHFRVREPKNATMH